MPRRLLTVLLVFASLSQGRTQADDERQREHFQKAVLPIFERRCFSCHSHAAQEMEGGLALDWRSGWEQGGGRGPAVIPGDSEKSLLVKAIQHGDAELKMPEDKLSDSDIAAIMQWINDGAFDDRTGTPAGVSRDNALDWWSLKPLVAPLLPADSKEKNPIDTFIAAKLDDQNLSSSPEADRRSLLRRLTFDLTGLPPTYDQIEQFERGDATAYETIVDELLASPQYGERWARHWMDTIHFADSHGYEHDVGRDNAWRYRDYLIQALNRDTPWDRFIREQLAVDHFFPDQTQLIPALGFLGAGTFDLSTFSTGPVTFDYLDRDDLVTQTMSAFVSTTANCARCHAHKFDPISQEDYYSLQAVFSGILKGDVSYDDDPKVGRRRLELQNLIAAADRRNANILLRDDVVADVEQWVQAHQGLAAWHDLTVETCVSTDGATLAKQPEGFVLASGPSPDVDTYVITGRTSLSKVTGVRLDVLPHESLPMNGPGRCQNGNLHLSEVTVQIFNEGSTSGRPVVIRQATADFNQTDWSIDKSLDGNLKTAWGIHPEEGRPHQAVFEFAEPQMVSATSRIAVMLRQLHGGSHVIGAFRLFVTDANLGDAIAIPTDVETAMTLPRDQRSPEQQLALAAFVCRRKSEAELKSLPAQSTVFAAASAVMVPAGNGSLQSHAIAIPKTVHVLHRGDFQKPGAAVEPGALSMLTHAPARFLSTPAVTEASRRASLADWLAHRDNPLTWRSVVNRIWHYHFGRGLCDTPSDFGRMGGIPSHPELLDWLAVWFRDDAHGSLKNLHRLIVTSRTYRQRSFVTDDNAVRQAQAVDSENRLLWRQNRQRLDADGFRDFTMVAAGTLDLKMGGPAIQNFHQSKGPQSTPRLDYVSYDWSTPGANRRSIYRCVWRGIPDPLMEALDFPDLGLLAPTRSFSASSLQSLALYNNNFVLYHAEQMARQVQQQQTTLDDQVTSVVRQVWLRNPSPVERDRFVLFAEQAGLPNLCRVLLNSNEFLFVD
ncbi:MAG: PSD1 and planctomycete cytochrome C domain-containing protein [Planctomycetota bacterium]